MGVSWAVTYLFVFLQLFTGLLLLRADLRPRGAARLLGTLFLVNAGVSAIMGLPREAAIWIASDHSMITRGYRALDVLTGYLLLAFLAARSHRPWGPSAARALVIVGAVVSLLEFPIHQTMVEFEYLTRALPLYAGLAIGAYVLAVGARWEQMLGLALIARSLYWGTSGWIEVMRTGLGDAPALYMNRVGLLLLAMASIVAAWRLARTPHRPPATVLLPVLLIGPAAALLETGVSRALPDDEFRYGSVVLINLVTLALVRPILVLLGLAPQLLVPILGRIAVASGLATFATLATGPFELGSAGELAVEGLAYGFGLCVGLVSIAAMEAIPSLHLPLLTTAGTQSATRAATGGPAADQASGPEESADASSPTALVSFADPSRPQWQVILLALRGSALRPGTMASGEHALTQRGLVEATGIRASRVSTVVRELNETAPVRLDAHLPGWRDRRDARGPIEIIQQYRGGVSGMPGVWVYYRLTSLGEDLARSIAGIETTPGAGNFRPESPDFRESSGASS